MTCKCTRKELHLTKFSVGESLSGLVVVLEVATVVMYLRRRRLQKNSSDHPHKIIILQVEKLSRIYPFAIFVNFGNHEK